MMPSHSKHYEFLITWVRHVKRCQTAWKYWLNCSYDITGQKQNFIYVKQSTRLIEGSLLSRAEGRSAPAADSPDNWPLSLYCIEIEDCWQKQHSPDEMEIPEIGPMVQPSQILSYLSLPRCRQQHWANVVIYSFPLNKRSDDITTIYGCLPTVLGFAPLGHTVRGIKHWCGISNPSRSSSVADPRKLILATNWFLQIVIAVSAVTNYITADYRRAISGTNKSLSRDGCVTYFHT